MDNILIGQALAKLLRRAGLSRAEVARKMGSSSASVSNWLNGHTAPSATNLAEFLSAIGFSFRDLQDAIDSPEGGSGSPAASLAGFSREDLLKILQGEARRMLVEAANEVDGDEE